MAPRSNAWDHKSDKDLLLTIISLGALKAIMWPTISEKMEKKGYTFSAEACRQHFQKLRKESSAENDNKNPGGKTQRRTKKDTPDTPNKAAGMTQAGSFHDNGEDDEEEMTPSLKRKRTVKSEDGLGFGGQTASAFKIESFNGADQPIDLDNDDLYDERDYI